MTDTHGHSQTPPPAGGHIQQPEPETRQPHGGPVQQQQPPPGEAPPPERAGGFMAAVRRWLRRLFMVALLGLIAVGGWWAAPRIIDSGLLSGLPVPDSLRGLTGSFGPPASDPPAPAPLPQDEPQQPAVIQELASAPLPPAEDPLTDAAAGIQDQLRELDGLLGGLEARLEALEKTSAARASLEGRLEQAETRIDGELLRLEDLAGLARREAARSLSRLDAADAAAEAGRKFLTADVKAVVDTLGTVRSQMVNLSARMDALAGDIHLLTRFGYGQAPQQARPADRCCFLDSPDLDFPDCFETNGKVFPGFP